MTEKGSKIQFSAVFTFIQCLFLMSLFIIHLTPTLLIFRLSLPFTKNYYLYPGKPSADHLFTARLRALIISTLDTDIVNLYRLGSFGFVNTWLLKA
jgi:hypothetical protein